MADSEGTETTQIEDATKSLEKEQPEPMDEEQSIAEVQEEAPKGNENGHQTDEAAPEGENKEEPSKDNESFEQTEELQEAIPEVEKEEGFEQTEEAIPEGENKEEPSKDNESFEQTEEATSEGENKEEPSKDNESFEQTEEATPEGENKEEPSKDNESFEQTEEATPEVEKEEGFEQTEEATPEVEKEEEGAKGSENGDQVSDKKETTEDKPSEDTQQAKSEEPTEAEKGHGATVAKHYNEHKENTREDRKTSPIFYLRNFNNWVKSVLINEFMEKYKRKMFRNLSVLDLACGKGGDLLKWQKARISNLVCADIAEVSMKQCEQRYKDLRYSRNHRRYNQSQKIYDAQFITADCTKEDISDQFNSRNTDVEFDMTSCQFALHYAFESAEQAEKMLQNACERLKPGGYLIGTMPCANEIINRVRQSEDMSFENDCYKISFTEKENISLFGHKYDFHLEGVVDCPEFLVHFPLLEKMAAKFGMTLELAQGFHHFFEDHKDKEEYKFLLNRMNALESYPPRREGDKLMSDKEDAYTQAKEILGEGDDKDDRKCVGTLSKDEWEATGLYMVFAFKKAEQEPKPTAMEEVKTDVDKMEQSEQQSVEKDGDKKDEEKMEEDKNVEEQDTETKMDQADEKDEGDKNDEHADKKGEYAEIKDKDAVKKDESADKKDDDVDKEDDDADKEDDDADKKDESADKKDVDVDKEDDDADKEDDDADKKDESADKKDVDVDKEDDDADKEDDDADKKDESADKKDDDVDKKDESADKEDDGVDKKDDDADKKDEVGDQVESGENASTEVLQGNEAGEQGDEGEENTQAKKKPTPQRGGRRKRSAGAAKDEAATPEGSTEVTPKRGSRKRKSTGGAEEEPPEKKKA